jgi:membrane-bound serine protease (ClpP class)
MTIIVITFLCGILAMFVEIFIPGGILGALGLLAVLGSILWAFAEGRPGLGIGLLAAIIAFAPFFLYLWKRFVGHLFALKNDDSLTAALPPPADIVGSTGQSVTPLHPSGLARIDGCRLDVVTRGEMLEKGTSVVVIEMAGNRIVVKEQTADGE